MYRKVHFHYIHHHLSFFILQVADLSASELFCLEWIHIIISAIIYMWFYEQDMYHIFIFSIIALFFLCASVDIKDNENNFLIIV